MDENSEIMLKTVCCACLSVDRKLTKLCRVDDGVNNLFFLLSYNSEAYEFSKGAALFSICWECKATMSRLCRFRDQVCTAQRQLADMVNGRIHIKPNSLSKLQYHHQEKYNCVIQNDCVPDNFIDCGPDINWLKTESDTDDIPLADLCVNNEDMQPFLINELNTGCMLKTNVKVVCKEVEYAMNVMTDEEMLESRMMQKLDDCYLNSSSKCESCIRSFKDANGLEKHLELHVQKPKHTQCDICLVYIKERILKEHKHTHYVKYVCNACEFVAYTILKMEDHLLNVHSVRREYKKVKRKAVNKSIKAKTDKTAMGYLCTECNKYFENKNKRYKHVQKHHRDGFKCSTCGKTFAFRNTLSRHERLHSSPLPREQCPTCGKLIRQDLVRAHANTHTHRQSYVCVACDKKFVSRASYENHLKYSSSHAVQDVLKYKCPDCKKGYRSRGELRDHVNYQHNGKTVHKCPICNKALATRRCITRHVRRAHHGIKENARDKICQTCGKAFRDRKCLREHELIHTGERPLACDICGRTFRQSASLYTHRRRVHSVAPSQRVVVHEEGSDW